MINMQVDLRNVLPPEHLERLSEMVESEEITLDEIMRAAVADYLDLIDDDLGYPGSTREESLARLQGMIDDADAGNTTPAWEALNEIREELDLDENFEPRSR